MPVLVYAHAVCVIFYDYACSYLYIYICRYCRAKHDICVWYICTQVLRMRDTHGLDLHTDTHLWPWRCSLALYRSYSPSLHLTGEMSDGCALCRNHTCMHRIWQGMYCAMCLYTYIYMCMHINICLHTPMFSMCAHTHARMPTHCRRLSSPPIAEILCSPAHSRKEGETWLIMSDIYIQIHGCS